MKLRQKLHSNSGESLIESLVAVLISALSITFLVTAIVSSTKITAQSRKAMDEYYSANDEVIIQSGEGTDGTMALTSSGYYVKITPEQENDRIRVRFYTNDRLRDVKVTSYKAD